MEQRSPGPRILGANDGKTLDLGSFGVRFMVWSEQSGGGFSLVEHPIPPRRLVAPLHRHANEDQYTPKGPPGDVGNPKDVVPGTGGPSIVLVALALLGAALIAGRGVLKR